MRKKLVFAVAGLLFSTLVVRALRRGRTRPRRTPMTPATGTVNAADAVIGPPGANEESRLDQALGETFPASDPVAIHIE